MFSYVPEHSITRAWEYNQYLMRLDHFMMVLIAFQTVVTQPYCMI